MKHIAVFALAGLVLAGSGCSSTLTHIQASYAPHDLSRPVQVYPRLNGEACEWTLFCMLPVGGDKSLNAALNALTRGSAKVDNLLAVQVEAASTCYLVIGKRCTQVSGYPAMYKDGIPKWELFEPNMMAGKLVKQPAVTTGGAVPGGGGAVVGGADPEPIGGGQPVGGGQPLKGGGQVVAKTDPPAGSAAPTSQQCETKCQRFAGLWKGSDAIRTTIRGQCVKKCLKPEANEYRNCVDSAASMDDIGKCNQM